MQARIVGQRNGHDFWYGAKLPSLQLDKIADCPLAPAFVLPLGPMNPNPDPNYGPTYPPLMKFSVAADENSYYKLPFSVGVSAVDWAHEHRRSKGVRSTPEWQSYAVDLGTPKGWFIRAARSGKVVLFEESDPWNWNDPNMPDDWTGIGNYIWVQHKDGSVAIYFHVMHNEVFPSQWQHVTRGEAIGKVGETGNAADHTSTSR